MSGEHISTAEENTEPSGRAQGAPAADASSVGSSAALISFFVIISRITGFVRTWAMAFALGSTMLASSYQVANNLPNMLYELVVGGMLVTAFLPVYISVKNKLGDKGGNEYASNLLSIVFIVLGLVALACTIFAPALIYTQSFMNDQGAMGDAVFFFRFFAMQIVFYGISTIVSGLLNASRDYLWSSAAPIFNNVIVAATFILYAFIAPGNPDLAKLVIAIGNPLGVFVQMAIQIPALKRNGIRFRPHIDLHDPYLRETLSIGVPAVIVMFAGMIIVSVQNSASYAYLDNGPSIIAYARLWFTLPYAFLTVPITTTLFTEISDMQTRGDMDGFKRAVVSGTNQILFFMIPFMMYLVVFAEPLVTLYHIGAFTEENISEIAAYLIALAVSLPVYGVNTYMQKTFSALRCMKHYAIMMVASAALQIGFIAVFLSQASAIPPMVGMATVALSETVYYLVLDVACFVYLRAKLGSLGLGSVVKAVALSLALGLLGAAVGAVLSCALQATIAPSDGSIPHALLRIVCGGIAALVVTFGLAIKFKLPEASFLLNIVGKVAGKLGGRIPARAKSAKDGGLSAQPNDAWREGARSDEPTASEPVQVQSRPSREGRHARRVESLPPQSAGRHAAPAPAQQPVSGRHAKPAAPRAAANGQAVAREGEPQGRRGKHERRPGEARPATQAAPLSYAVGKRGRHEKESADSKARRGRHAKDGERDE